MNSCTREEMEADSENDAITIISLGTPWTRKGFGGMQIPELFFTDYQLTDPYLPVHLDRVLSKRMPAHETFAYRARQLPPVRCVNEYVVRLVATCHAIINRLRIELGEMADFFNLWDYWASEKEMPELMAILRRTFSGLEKLKGQQPTIHEMQQALRYTALVHYIPPLFASQVKPARPIPMRTVMQVVDLRFKCCFELIDSCERKYNRLKIRFFRERLASIFRATNAAAEEQEREQNTEQGQGAAGTAVVAAGN